MNDKERGSATLRRSGCSQVALCASADELRPLPRPCSVGSCGADGRAEGLRVKDDLRGAGRVGFM